MARTIAEPLLNGQKVEGGRYFYKSYFRLLRKKTAYRKDLDFNLSARRNLYPHHFEYVGDIVLGVEEVFY